MAYQPVRSALAPDAPGDPLALARAFRDEVAAHACYVADLDAIGGGPLQVDLLRRLADSAEGFGGPLLVDGGAADRDRAHAILACGAARVIVGLETLPAFADLAAIVTAVGAPRVVFSLDLHLGRPVMHHALTDLDHAAAGALDIAERAVAAGARSLLLLDIGRVGTGAGVDLELVGVLRRRMPEVELLVGGGIQGRHDLDRLSSAGCDGALVATALHAGRVGARDVHELRATGRPAARRQSDARLVR